MSGGSAPYNYSWISTNFSGNNISGVNITGGIVNISSGVVISGSGLVFQDGTIVNILNIIQFYSLIS